MSVYRPRQGFYQEVVLILLYQYETSLPHQCGEMKKDLMVWQEFLNNPIIYCRPFIDFSKVIQASELDWYTDASGVIGLGGYHLDEYFMAKWDQEFLARNNPSIQYLELYAVTVSIFLWGGKYQNSRIRLFCDNDGAVKVLNKSSSGCKNCMVLIRMIVAKCLQWNLRVFGKHIETDENIFADALSRGQMGRFWLDVHKYGKDINTHVLIPDELWPMQKI